MHTHLETPSSWAGEDAPMLLHTPDGKPFALGRKLGEEHHEPLDPRTYTREQIGQLRALVEQNGGVGSYQEGHRRYILNVLHNELHIGE